MTRDYDEQVMLPTARTTTPLHISDDQLASCVGCGLCLPHCPTYRVSGDEALSPRGRIATIRRYQWEGIAFDADSVHALSTCIQCRGCEPACPSGVPYGRLIEAANERMATDRLTVRWWQRLALRSLTRHRLLTRTAPLLSFGRRIRIVPRRLVPTSIPTHIGPPVAITPSPDVWIFTGCVMDAWQRSTHRSVAAIASALDIRYSAPRESGSCCGALHSHQGLTDDARLLARQVMDSMPGDSPIVVDSAGCGAALKDYGHLLGTDEALVFSRRVLDVHEWLVPHMPRLLEGRSLPTRKRVIVQDPCHLRHVQKAHQAVRNVLASIADVVELDDDGLCCGAGGAYSVLQPEMAAAVRDRKVAAIERASGGATLPVASANPGCLMHLAGAQIDVRHPIDIVTETLGLRA